MTTIVNRIRERLAAVGKSPRKASLEAGLGPDYIRDLARSKNGSPSMAAIEKLAPVLDTTVDWLRGAELLTKVMTVKPLPNILGGFDLPLYRSVEAGSGYIVVTNTPVRKVQRPAKLEGNEDAFAVVVAGESMSPEYEPGDMLFVDPHKPLVRDRNFIFIDDRHGDWKACVKRLRSWNNEVYAVFQHNPGNGDEQEFELRRAEWPKAFRVLGKFDRD